MEKIIQIEDTQVRFVCSIGTMVKYRSLFGSGMMEDVQILTDGFKDTGAVNEKILAQLAYAMAKQGDPSIGTMDEWLDQFNIFAFFDQMTPEVIALWNESSESSVKAKKK